MALQNNKKYIYFIFYCQSYKTQTQYINIRNYSRHFFLFPSKLGFKIGDIKKEYIIMVLKVGSC